MTIRVRDVMQTKLQTVGPKMTVRELEGALIAHHVSGFPVVEDGRLVGVVTRSDIVRTLVVEHTFDDQVSDYYAFLARPSASDAAEAVIEMGARVGARIEGMSVADVMVTNVITAAPDESIEEVAWLMVDKGIHRLPVTQAGALVGMITSLDLAGLIADGRLREGR